MPCAETVALTTVSAHEVGDGPPFGAVPAPPVAVWVR